jgi:hypothetical protein
MITKGLYYQNEELAMKELIHCSKSTDPFKSNKKHDKEK